jgi:predicted NBD/HSP70 family sugar kinase
MSPPRRTARRASARPAPGLAEPRRAQLFSLALRFGPVTRAQLAEWTGLDASTVTRSLRPLIEDDYLEESGSPIAGRGRPVQVLSVNPGRHLAVGIKIGPSDVSGVLTDLGARVLARQHLALRSTEPERVLRAAADLVASLLSAAGVHRSEVLGVGVGLSGHIDQHQGVCRVSAILGWRDIAVRDPLSARVGLPVVVENDVNTLALAEHWFGRGRGVQTLAVVTLGVGIGCGLVLGDRLHTGVAGMAGELGHLPLDPAGALCTCGARGCLEALAGDAAICAASGCGSVEEAMGAAQGRGHGAEAAQEAFRLAGSALGRGVAGLCNLVDPELLIIAGESAPAFALMEDAMRDSLAAHAFSRAAAEVRIEVDEGQEDLWTRGAASVAIHAALGGPQG